MWAIEPARPCDRRTRPRLATALKNVGPGTCACTPAFALCRLSYPSCFSESATKLVEKAKHPGSTTNHVLQRPFSPQSGIERARELRTTATHSSFTFMSSRAFMSPPLVSRGFISRVFACCGRRFCPWSAKNASQVSVDAVGP